MSGERRAVLLSTAVIALAGIADARGVILLTRPAGAVVAAGSVVIEGTVETDAVRAVSIVAEPFVRREIAIPGPQRATVREGRFAGMIDLPAGVYLIRVSAGSDETVAPVFVRDAGRPPLDQDVRWGVSSPVLFAAPRDARTDRSPVEFKGLVSDDSVRALDVIVVDAESLADIGFRRPALYRRIRLDQRIFAFEVPLREGLNLVLAKPAGISPAPEGVQLKSILYERTAAGLAVDEPAIVKNRLVVRGSVADRSRRSVVVRVEALVESRDTAGELRQETILVRTVPVGPEGVFAASFPWEPERGGRRIVSFPVVRVTAGEESVSRMVIRW